MIRALKLFLTLVVLMALCSGCCIHLFPEEKPETNTTVKLRLEYSPDFYLWPHYYDPKIGSIEEVKPDAREFEGHPGATEKYSNIPSSGLYEVSIKIYEAGIDGAFVSQHSFIREINGDYDTDVDIEVPADRELRVLVWCHLLRDNESQAFYDFSNFNQVKLISDNYIGNSDWRDGFRGSLDLKTSDADTERHVVNMRRPMGKFELVTTDLSEFLDRETRRRNMPTRARADEYRVVISFPMYYPNSYSVVDDRLENSVGGVKFITNMTVTGESDASLGFEYVFLNDVAQSGVQMRVDIFDPEGTHVAGSSTITVPMRRDGHTLLRGAFLSETGNGGVGLDPSYNGEHNVIM